MPKSPDTDNSNQSAQPQTWEDVLGPEKQQPYFAQILEFLQAQANAGKTIYPPKADIFRALKLTAFSEVKVVILGQDPYHGPRQANGLAFSVARGLRIPPSLVNILKEINSDLGHPIPDHGDLSSWAEQGVLLLNTALTVEAHQANSHRDCGWSRFTDAIIAALSQAPQRIVFLLWGANAIKKSSLIDADKNWVLTAPHPSPLSAHRGFLGCKHFSQTNQYLESVGDDGIDWSLD